MEQQPQPSSSATTTSSSSPSSSQRWELQLQGLRPAPLKVRKDSHKIRKPPPPQPGGGGGGGPVQQVRQPVIIYTESPKVVHAEPSEFMSVVQRLTGARGTTASSSSLPVPPPPGATTTEPHHDHHQIQMTSSSLPIPFPFLGCHQYVHGPSSPSSAQPLPPAAPHFPFQLQQQQQQQQAPGVAVPHDHLMVQLSPAARLGIEQQAAAAAARSSGGTAASDVVGGSLLPPFPSILSPGSLPAIPPSFFSPPTPAGNSYPGISFFGGLISPAFLGNETTGGGSMNIASIAGASHQSVTMSSSLQEASPSTVTPSPSAGAYYWDLFNNQQH